MHGPVNCVAWYGVLHVPLIGAVVVVVLRSHGESNAAVAEAGFWAILNLSAGNAANNTRLGEAGACEGVWVVQTVVLFFCIYMVLAVRCGL